MIRWAALALAFVLAVVSGCHRRSTTAGADASPPAASIAPQLPPRHERTPAPAGFEGATAWLNTTRPLDSKDFEGRVVVVDFWTSGCINCMHTLPLLEQLEKDHPGGGFVVVGVHSAKFDTEKENERLRAALVESSVTHPVAVDGAMKIWNAWGVHAWPTIFVLDAHGNVVWRHSGEADKKDLAEVVQAAITEARSEGALRTMPIAGLAPEAPDTGPLAFPGKVVALADGGVAISDTLHHRVLFADKTFAVKEVVGNGLAGATDGGFAEASFHKPQGLAEAGDRVYVADTENHEIRVIDRAKKTVATVAGTGELARAILKTEGSARTTALRSPWAVAFTGGLLYVALAGSHQIAVLDPERGTIAPFAGNGEERRVDGAGPDASFAQPSGLTTDGKTLWVADAESSSIRAITIATRAVRTIVGKDLFVFGDVDGAAEAVRLEHPLGIVYGAPKGQRAALWIADTYNSKVKRIDLATGSTRSVAGGRAHDLLFEPGGITIAGGDLVVADTKHHRVARVALLPEGDGKVEPIALSNVTAPPRGVAVAGAADAGGPGAPIEKVEIPEVPIRADAQTVVNVGWSAPPGTAVNDDAPFRVRWNRSDGLAEAPHDVKSTGSAVKNGFTVTVKPMPGAPNATLGGEVDLVICDVATHAVCVPVKRALELGFMVGRDAPAQARVSIPLPQAKP